MQGESDIIKTGKLAGGTDTAVQASNTDLGGAPQGAMEAKVDLPTANSEVAQQTVAEGLGGSGNTAKVNRISDKGVSEIVDAGQGDFRLINSQPSGVDGPQITFNNDVVGGLNTNQPVDPDLAAAIEDSVTKTGFDINVNSTTGGHFSGPHLDGRAADINYINGLHVSDLQNIDNVRGFQKALIEHSNTNQVLGPVLNVNKWYNAPLPSLNLIKQHLNHIHANVYP